MVIIFRKRANSEQLKKVSKDLDGYIKFVVDVEKRILAAGGLRHVDAEQLLLKDESMQTNLWGGGLDLETGEVDFDSMINIRPNRDNPSREVLLKNVRAKMEEIISDLLK